LIIRERRLASAAADASRGVFVGRADELAVLEAVLRRRPAVASLRWCWSRGEAGVSKSSLLAWFAAGLAGVVSGAPLNNSALPLIEPPPPRHERAG